MSEKLDPVLISWSSLKRWEHCPQHQLRKIQGKTTKGDGRIFLPGTISDRAMRRWLDSDNPQPGEMVEMIDTIFDEHTGPESEYWIKWRGNPAKDKAEVKAFCRELVTRLEPWLMDKVLPYDYQPEWRFRAHMDIPYLNEDVTAPVTLIGGADILVRGPEGRFRIYDLKATRDDSYMRSTLGQLTFYDIACCIIQGSWETCEEWAFVAPMTKERYIPIEVTKENRREMMARVVKYAHGFWREQWQPKADDTGCQWCEAKGACDKFKTVAVVDENGRQKVSFAEQAARRKAARGAA